MLKASISFWYLDQIICIFRQIVAKELIAEGQYGEETETSVTIVVTDIDDELPVFNREAEKTVLAVPEDIG